MQHRGSKTCDGYPTSKQSSTHSPPLAIHTHILRASHPPRSSSRLCYPVHLHSRSGKRILYIAPRLQVHSTTFSSGFITIDSLCLPTLFTVQIKRPEKCPKVEIQPAPFSRNSSHVGLGATSWRAFQPSRQDTILPHAVQYLAFFKNDLKPASGWRMEDSS
ncbi:hypothetical protein BJV74DRAFT_428462 [Russula compacta]|nr:hypothetical protein BJV74DRAFT_428462 [Russula compacta]